MGAHRDRVGCVRCETCARPLGHARGQGAGAWCVMGCARCAVHRVAAHSTMSGAAVQPVVAMTIGGAS